MAKTQSFHHLFPLRIWLIAFFLASYLVNFLHPATTFAQSASNLDFAVSPPTAYLSVKPGGTMQHTLLLENHSNQRLEVSAKLVDFTPDGKTGHPIIGDGSIFDQLLKEKFNLDKPFILEPGQQKQIQLKLAINPTAAQKEYPLTILFTAQTAFPLGEKQSSAQAKAIIGSNIILLISPDEQDRGEIILNELNYPKIIDSFGKLNFAVLAENTGNNATATKGEVIIKNLFHKTVAEYLIYPDMILAGSTRELRFIDRKQAKFDDEGKLEPEQTAPLLDKIKYKQPFLFGIYSVELKLGQASVAATILALPFSIIVAIFVGVGIYLGYQKLQEKY